MQNKLKLTLFVAVLALAGLACAALPDSGSGGGDGGADSNILFQDDFSSTSSGWKDLYEDETGMVNYDQGGFRILVLEANFDYWANADQNFSDTVIEVDATKIGGPDDNDFGVICRYSDSDNFYFLILASDGFYGIGKYTNGEQSLIGSDSLNQTDKINTGDASNRIRAECVGNSLRLSVNGSLLHEVNDSDHRSGDVGLMAGTFDTPGTDILFDNFVVRRP